MHGSTIFTRELMGESPPISPLSNVWASFCQVFGKKYLDFFALFFFLQNVELHIRFTKLATVSIADDKGRVSFRFTGRPGLKSLKGGRGKLL